MGFFSELKNDLAAAVVPDKPDDELKNSQNEQEGQKVDLDSLLNNLDDMKLGRDNEEDSDNISSELETSAGSMGSNSLETPADINADDNTADDNTADNDTKSEEEEIATVTVGMTINGDVETEGSLNLRGSIFGDVAVKGKLNISGTIEGNSTAAEIFADTAKIMGDMKSAGAVKVGQGTVVIGSLWARSAVVAGAVKGNIDVNGPVILDSTAIVMGNIKSESVQINNGAVVQGMCSQDYADVNPKNFFEKLEEDVSGKSDKLEGDVKQ